MRVAQNLDRAVLPRFNERLSSSNNSSTSAGRPRPLPAESLCTTRSVTLALELAVACSATDVQQVQEQCRGVGDRHAGQGTTATASLPAASASSFAESVEARLENIAEAFDEGRIMAGTGASRSCRCFKWGLPA
jgi:hypothetical protein